MNGGRKQFKGVLRRIRTDGIKFVLQAFCRIFHEYTAKAAWSSKATQGRIIKMCQHMQNVTLKHVDPVLAKALDDAAIEPQIWGM